MRSREERRRRKARIKSRLIEMAVEWYSAVYARHRSGDGKYKEPVIGPEGLPREGYYRLGRVLRNEGRGRSRRYRCGSGYCGWCIGNLTHRTARRHAAMDADLEAWMTDGYPASAGTVHNFAEEDAAWAEATRWRLVGEFIEVLDALARDSVGG
jgi:hypothetical protein